MKLYQRIATCLLPPRTYHLLSAVVEENIELVLAVVAYAQVGCGIVEAVAWTSAVPVVVVVVVVMVRGFCRQEPETVAK